MSQPTQNITNQQFQMISNAVGSQAAAQGAMNWWHGTAPASLPISASVLGLFGTALEVDNAGSKLVTPDYTNLESWKVYLQSVISEHKLVNATPGTITLWCYDVVSKVTKVAYTTPYDDYVAGLTAITGSSTVTTTNPGIKPTDSKSWNLIWNVVKKRKVIMKQGETYCHTFNFQTNRYVDTTYYNKFAQVRGLTSGTMFTAVGPIYDDKDDKTFNAVATTTGVGYAAVKVAGVINQRYKVRVCNVLPRHTVYSENLNTTGTAQYVMDWQEGGKDNLATVTEYA